MIIDKLTGFVNEILYPLGSKSVADVMDSHQRAIISVAELQNAFEWEKNNPRPDCMQRGWHWLNGNSSYWRNEYLEALLCYHAARPGFQKALKQNPCKLYPFPFLILPYPQK